MTSADGQSRAVLKMENAPDSDTMWTERYGPICGTWMALLYAHAQRAVEPERPKTGPTDWLVLDLRRLQASETPMVQPIHLPIAVPPSNLDLLPSASAKTRTASAPAVATDAVIYMSNDARAWLQANASVWQPKAAGLTGLSDVTGGLLMLDAFDGSGVKMLSAIFLDMPAPSTISREFAAVVDLARWFLAKSSFVVCVRTGSKIRSSGFLP
jgi:hypothetical protein